MIGMSHCPRDWDVRRHRGLQTACGVTSQASLSSVCASYAGYQTSTL